jgi:hypothetical protein
VYSTCLFCHAGLGSNEVIETFPVGKRLAFDAEKGRLWAVCPRCGRWNLTPLEERWEAVEACERRFRGTVLRTSTDNIGLTRLREGLDLIRVGRPLRPELASWRYASTFQRRWRKHALVTVGLIGIGIALPFGLSAAGIGVSVYQFWNLPYQLRKNREKTRVSRRVVSDTGKSLAVTDAQISKAVMLPTGDRREWTLEFPYVVREDFGASMERRAILSGDHALRALGLMLPRLNAAGGGAYDVQAAVERLEKAGSAHTIIARAARRVDQERRVDKEFSIAKLARDERLALEIVAHEDTERRAMEGEFAELERAWREAEEIAGIADNMFLPPSVTEFFKGRS